MRLLFDCFKLVKGSGKSIGIYNGVRDTLQNMVRYKENTTDERIKNAELIVIGNPINRKDFEMEGLTFECVSYLNPVNKLHALWWELFRVVKECKRLKADRIVFPRGFSAVFHPVKDTVLIHDMIPFYYNENHPGYFNRIENAYIMRRLIWSARSSDRVVTRSNASKQDIIKYSHVKDSKITVQYSGCNEKGQINGSDKLRPDKPYIAAVTSKLPHKNAPGIVSSYIEYFRIADDPLDLVIIGIDDVEAYEVPEEVKRHITCYRYIKEDADMYGLIGVADIFLFLSKAEGFGLPPVEAMQLGVPVVCSNRMSLPEIVGDAAILTDPDDHAAVARSLAMLAGNEAERQRLIEKGYENIKRFSWDDLVKEFWEEYLR